MKKLKQLLAYLEVFTVKRVVILLALLLGLCSLIVAFLVINANVAVFNPAGIIARKEMDLFIFTTILGLMVIIPVFILLFAFAWRYREGNKKRKAKYTPESGGSKLFEIIWWGIPLVIIAILGVVTWVSTHDLDPYKKIASDKKPLTIQVVALEWKWLFIYPEQKVASLNEVRFPEKTPIEFEITADAPMSAFWIPNLGSQIYAMKGMSTKLNLMADTNGEYIGMNTNINGEGYSKMTFTAHSLDQAAFDEWVLQNTGNSRQLSWENYEALVKQSKQDPPVAYSLPDEQIFQKIVDQYMSHGPSPSHDMMEEMEGH